MTTAEDLIPDKPVTIFFATDFGTVAANGDPNSFMVRKEYLFGNVEFRLPVRINFGLTFETQGEIFPCFSSSKFLEKDDVSICWFFGSKRHDTTFKTGNDIPKVKRPH